MEPHTQVAAVHGDGHLETVSLRCTDGAERVVAASSLFILIGAAPRTDWLGDLVARDAYGFILTGADLPREPAPEPTGQPTRVRDWPLDREPYLLETSRPGIFCAGDVRHQSVKRVASAVGEGAIAVQFTHRYLAEA